MKRERMMIKQEFKPQHTHNIWLMISSQTWRLRGPTDGKSNKRFIKKKEEKSGQVSVDTA